MKTGICISGPACIVRKRIAIPPDQKNPQKLTRNGEEVERRQVDDAAADLHPEEERQDREERRHDRPADERGDRVAEHDPAAVRRREQQPLREAALEVARHAEAR